LKTKVFGCPAIESIKRNCWQTIVKVVNFLNRLFYIAIKQSSLALQLLKSF